MKVSEKEPFKVVYSIYHHEHFGVLFESYVVALDANGGFSLKYQNISSKNVYEFSLGLSVKDFELVKLIEKMEQDNIIDKFYKRKNPSPEKFFAQIYDPEKGDKLVQQQIDDYLEKIRLEIMEAQKGSYVYETAKDGYPVKREFYVSPEPASVLFHFKRTEEGTNYYPTVKHEGDRVRFQNNNSFLVTKAPAWLLAGDKAYHFDRYITSSRIKPFLEKNHVHVPKKLEPTYYQKFVKPTVQAFNCTLEGVDVEEISASPKPKLLLEEIVQQKTGHLFEEEQKNGDTRTTSFILIRPTFDYAGKVIKPGDPDRSQVTLKEEENGDFAFQKLNRDVRFETTCIQKMISSGLEFNGERAALPRGQAFSWLAKNMDWLEELGFDITQKQTDGKKYFIGKCKINLEIKESIDWFDIFGHVQFGLYEIPILEIRKYILRGKNEFKLPDGSIAVIPDSWFEHYKDFFNFVEQHDGVERLPKYHFALVEQLNEHQGTGLSMSSHLQKLRDFKEIGTYDLSPNFQGQLRPYQQAGYDWLRFLSEFRFGGCLADDMGLGKTVQTLAMLQHHAEQNPGYCSLLVLPTSLVYNWQQEAERFTPNLKIHIYQGADRQKSAEIFQSNDLVITSYGVLRIDIDLFDKYEFQYVVLDESQTIKNPDSLTAKAVLRVKGKHRLALSGTPIENTTMDLWSQMNFVNPGLLGTQKFFRNEYQIPIEKHKNEDKMLKLNRYIKPFLLRRHKSQVAKDLPDKVQNVQYCEMPEDQQAVYDEINDQYRNAILDLIEEDGLGKSAMVVLQGLTKLRQIANHPKMVDKEYEGESGKLEEVKNRLESALTEGHKILIFSQFVKHLQIVRQYLKSQKISFAYIDGSTSDRQGQVKKFQENEDLQVFLISLKAGGLGLNLTAADYVFLLDPWWNPAVEAQAIDRAHRIGQKNQVFIYRFITKNSVEEKIFALQQRKLALAEELITTESSFVKSLSQEDIQMLFNRA